MSKKSEVEFTIWLQERQTVLLRAAKAICFDTQNAEDVLQETLADVYSKWDRVSQHENLEAYCVRVMVSKHADLRRKCASRTARAEIGRAHV